jgi:hypothetical protein
MGGRVSYGFEDFEVMLGEVREPFKADIEGHVVTVSEFYPAVMMKQSASTYITTENVLVSNKKQTGENKQATKGATSNNLPASIESAPPWCSLLCFTCCLLFNSFSFPFCLVDATNSIV